ncbi:response regulator transcription factor [Paraburkholderia fynbosensis]|uniref:Response regulator protein TmoT n=1 Tax=Paraburkholderia fynbosensis TaxID=1200993 RepID=A0A6J5H1Z0_9BURK|nr:response regulator [Paraburkholderia fynbosensis]CAB3810255.1 Response regulator protein TmoT [Paraburkholderia fynbosensis]
MTAHAEAVIHVVDDDDATRTALMRLLNHAGFRAKGYPSAGDFLVAEPEASHGCLVLDLELPGPGGLDLQHTLQRMGKSMPIVFISAHHDIPRTVMAIKAGASDFLLKPIDSQALFAAIEAALATITVEPVVGVPTRVDDDFGLNAREQTVLRGIVAGRLNKQIAAELALSERTIKTCRADLMRKLHAHSLAELVRLAEPIVRARSSV